jgi:hypothetical protein
MDVTPDACDRRRSFLGLLRSCFNTPKTAVAVIAPIVVLSFYCLLSGFQIISTGCSTDEICHIPAGCSYWITDDYRLNPEHPPLVKRIAALPVLLLNSIRGDCDPLSMFYGNSRASKEALKLWDASLQSRDSKVCFSWGNYFFYGLKDDALARFAQLPCWTCLVVAKQAFINNADVMLQSARLMMLIFPCILGILIYRWSLELWGLRGALLSIVLFCFDPNFLAHGGIVLTDLPFSCLFFATIYFYWRYLRNATIYDGGLACLSFALAQITKFSAVLLLPVLLLLSITNAVRMCLRSKTDSESHGLDGDKATWCSRRELARGVLVSGIPILGALLLSWIVIWWAYSWRFEPVPPHSIAGTDEPNQVLKSNDVQWTNTHFPLKMLLRECEAADTLKTLYPRGTAVDRSETPVNLVPLMPAEPTHFFSRVMLQLADWKLLPESYLYGVAFVKRDSTMRPAYLFGDVSRHGFPTYFLWCFLLKSTLVFLLLLLAACVHGLGKRSLWKFDALCLWAPVAVYLLLAGFRGINMGHRHIMPLYPFLFVFVGSLATLPLSRLGKLSKALLVVCVSAAIVVSSSFVFSPPTRPQVVFPDYLTYFNELAGGPDDGWQCLIEGNLDMGQSLKLLAAWMKAKRLFDPIYLCYYGVDSPAYEGIPHVQVQGGGLAEPACGIDQVKAPSYLAMSVQAIVGYGMPPSLHERWMNLLKDRCSLVTIVDHCIYVYQVRK